MMEIAFSLVLTLFLALSSRSILHPAICFVACIGNGFYAYSFMEFLNPAKEFQDLLDVGALFCFVFSLMAVGIDAIAYVVKRVQRAKPAEPQPFRRLVCVLGYLFGVVIGVT